MGLLDIYNNIGTQLNQIYNDYSTAYPSTNTGTPTNTQNPGGPVDTFHQNYDENDKYLDTTNLYNGKLKHTLEITNFDVEDPSVQGGPLSDTTTQYPSTITGTPTPFANPGGPLTNFSPPNNPNATFLTNYFQSRYRLYNTFYTTNLDVEHPGVQGGPVGDGTTSYPSTVTGTPTSFANPGGPLNWFYPNYTPHFKYIYNIPGNGDGKLRYTLDITNLDVENPNANGGPLNDTKTNYPAYSTGTPNTNQNSSLFFPYISGVNAKRFIHLYSPSNEYLSNTHIQLRKSLNVTNLDVENSNVQGGPLNDTTTQYPPLVTGTPTNNQNPGGQPNRFSHIYTPSYQYWYNYNNGKLRYTLDITNFDVQNPSVDGGPARPSDDPTSYPSLVTGVPTNTQNPGGPVHKFKHIYKPNTTYLSVNPIKGLGSGKLDDSLDITNLDVENPSVDGGPARPSDDPTQYPSTNTGTPTNTQNPGGPVRKFKQVYKPNKEYIYNIPNNGDGELKYTLDITNFDVQNPSVDGGPARPSDDPTHYPSTNTGTPTNTQNPGGPVRKFKQIYKPNVTYLSLNPIQGFGSGKLDDSLDITNLDVENPSVLGGPVADNVTQYSPFSSGTPTIFINNLGNGPFNNSGAPPNRFRHPYHPYYTYLFNLPNGGSGVLANTLNITNFDIENSNVQGGPLDDTTTIYPSDVTGVPTSTINYSIFNAGSGTPGARFQHKYTFVNKYNSLIGTLYSPLFNTLDITNFDVQNPKPLGGPNPDNSTVYPPSNVTHTSPIRGWFAEPSQPPSKFNQLFTPLSTYEKFIEPYIQ